MSSFESHPYSPVQSNTPEPREAKFETLRGQKPMKAAAHVKDHESLTFLQAVRKWPRASMYALLVSFNIILMGFDAAIVGNVSSMPVFQHIFGEPSPVAEGEYIISSIWLSLWSLSLPIGTMIGAVAGGWFQDLTGRKSANIIGGLLSIGAIAICYFSDIVPQRNACFFGGKLVEGIAVGIIMVATQTYLSEVTPPRLRGPVMALFPALQLFGQLMAAVVVFFQTGVRNESSYRTAIASEWGFSIIPILLGFFIPESTPWLLHKERMEDARNSFRKLHGTKHASEHQELFEDMNNAVNEERWAAKERPATYIECFRETNLRRTLLVIYANTIPELFGLPLLAQVSYFLQILGMDHSTSFVILMCAVTLSMLSSLGSFWTLLRFGRVVLTVVTMAIITVLWGALGIAGCFSGMAVVYFAAAAIMAIDVVAGFGAWPASYVIASESSSLRLRSKTQGIGWFFGGLGRCAFGMGVPYLYNSDSGNLGGKTGFIFCAFSALGVYMTWAYVPEMKGRSAFEIDRLFERRLPARAFKTAVAGSIEDGDAGIPLSRMDEGA